MKKRILLIALSFCLALFFVSCSGSKDNPRPDDSGQNEGTNNGGTNNSSTNNSSGKDDNEPNEERTWEIKNGKFYENGKVKFLKIAKVLRGYAPATMSQLIDDLDILKEKGYNVVSYNCYWDQFADRDGNLMVSLKPLQVFVDSVYSKGMYPAISIETYTVGGGHLPSDFFDKYPEALALDERGETMIDEQYGFGSAIVSIFHEGYRESTHSLIKNILSALDTDKILFYETTVEPQYYLANLPDRGLQFTDYSEIARAKYEGWLEENNLNTTANKMPEDFPIPRSFVDNLVWNRFRAQSLADWINKDAAAFREVAGENAYIAVDFLYTQEVLEKYRVGNAEEFLKYLTSPNIVQVNWHWNFVDQSPNYIAYDLVKDANEKYDRDWAISEHMTLNGHYDTQYEGIDLPKLSQILQNTLNNNSGFGWDFVNVWNNTGDPFALYNNDWTPKRAISVVDDQWDSKWFPIIKEKFYEE